MMGNLKQIRILILRFLIIAFLSLEYKENFKSLSWGLGQKCWWLNVHLGRLIFFPWGGRGGGHRFFNFFMFPLHFKQSSSQYVPKDDFNSTTP
jgi:hypothetical protein